MTPSLPDVEALESARVLTLGGAALTLGGLISAALLMTGAVVLSWLAARALRRVRERRGARHAQALYLLEKLAGYGILVAGAVLALGAAGLCSQLALGVHGLVDAVTWDTRPAVLVWVLWGLTAAAWGLARRTKAD